MRLTAYTDYSLRVLIYLALQPGRLATIREISERYDLSRNHLMKIVHELGKEGFVETVRGNKGGIRLQKPPEQVTVGEIVRAMEDGMNIAECFKPGVSICQIAPACVLKGVLHEALENFLAVLDRYTLADLTKPNTDLTRLVGLDVPHD